MKRLTIKNFTALFGSGLYRDKKGSTNPVLRYRIVTTLELNDLYVIVLHCQYTFAKMSIYLERQSEFTTNLIKNKIDISYKMWYEKNDIGEIEYVYFNSEQLNSPEKYIHAINHLLM